MTRSPQCNREMAEKIIRIFDPSYHQRWEIYDGILRRLTGSGARWLDGGCGKNSAIEEFPSDITVGLDIYHHPGSLHKAPCHLVIGDMKTLPFRDGAFTLVTLNTVVEHFEDPGAVFKEIFRVLEPGGHVLIHTTNRISPLIMLGKLVPEALRIRLMRTWFGAEEHSVFKTYHRLNTIPAFRNIEGFDPLELHAVQDMNWTNRAVFFGLLAFHLMTKIPGLWRLRSNFLVVLRKKAS